MSTRVDHAKQAQEWIMRALNPSDAFERSSAAKVAEVHATLALVEQQRLANLIALATGVDVVGGTGIARIASDEAHKHLVSDPNGALRPEIKEALGLS